VLKKAIAATALTLFSATLFAQPASALVQFPYTSPLPTYLDNAYGNLAPNGYKYVPCAAKGEGPIYWTATTAPSDLKYKDAFVADLKKAYSYISQITGDRIQFEYVDTTNMKGVVHQLRDGKFDPDGTGMTRFWEDTRIRYTVALTRPVVGNLTSPGTYLDPNSPNAHVSTKAYYRTGIYNAQYSANTAPVNQVWPKRYNFNEWEANGFDSPGSVDSAGVSFTSWRNPPADKTRAANLVRIATRPMVHDLSNTFMPEGLPVISDLDYYLLNFIADESCNYDWSVQAARETPNDQLAFGINSYFNQKEGYGSLGKVSAAANPPAGWNGPPKAPVIKGVTTVSYESSTSSKLSKKAKCKKFKKAGKKKKYKKCLSTIQ
jgi:hypothetical protein